MAHFIECLPRYGAMLKLTETWMNFISLILTQIVKNHLGKEKKVTLLLYIELRLYWCLVVIDTKERTWSMKTFTAHKYNMLSVSLYH